VPRQFDEGMIEFSRLMSLSPPVVSMDPGRRRHGLPAGQADPDSTTS
jgi:hypothetical protein